MKPETKKLIISKTILFFIIVGFIILFQNIFGADNTLVGVGIINGALMLLERNLTTHKGRYLMELIGLNVLLGVLSYVAFINPLMAFVANFIGMFLIGFIFSYDVRRNMYVAFGLLYVFMLATPIEKSGLPMRISALVFGAIFIMILQLLINKNKVEKQGLITIKSLINITEDLIIEKDQDVVKELIGKFDGISVNLKQTIYDGRKEYFYICNNGKAMIDIMLFLKTICNKRNEIRDKDIYISILKEIKENIEDKAALNKLLNNEIVKEDTELLAIIKSVIKVDKNGDINCELDIPLEFKRKDIMKRYFNKNSMRFRYATRLGLAIGFASMCINYFEIFQGKWMIFTIFALIQPYGENAIDKTKHRIQGTLIGAMVGLAIYSLVTMPILITLVGMLAGYIDGFNKNYRNKMICVTISAVGASLILGGAIQMLITRIIMICIGAVFSTIINKVILPYSIEDAKEELLSIYDANAEKIILEIQEENKNGTLENLYIISYLIENKLKEFNLNEEIKEQKNEVLSKYFKFKKKNLA